MGSIRVPEGMDADIPFGGAGHLLCPAEGSLHTAPAHWFLSDGHLPVIPSCCREDPDGVSVGFPILAQDEQGLGGKRHVAVLGTFAPVDMDHHPAAVDIGDLEEEAFMETEPATICSRQVGAVMEGVRTAKQALHFFDTEHRGKPVFGLGPEKG